MFKPNYCSVICGVVVGLLFIGKAGGGPIFASMAGVGCAAVCGAGAFACWGASTTIDAALLTNPLTAPFVGVLAPIFANGCLAGYSACMTACVGSVVIAPTP